jgi:hypothetical protein
MENRQRAVGIEAAEKIGVILIIDFDKLTKNFLLQCRLAFEVMDSTTDTPARIKFLGRSRKVYCKPI